MDKVIQSLHKSTFSALMNNQITNAPIVCELVQNRFPNITELTHKLRRTNTYEIRYDNSIIRHNMLLETVYRPMIELYNEKVCNMILCIDINGNIVDDKLIYIIADERIEYINCSDPFTMVQVYFP